MEVIEFLKVSREFCKNYSNGCDCHACPANFYNHPENHFCHDDIGEDFEMAPMIKLNYAPIKNYISHLEKWVADGKPKAIFQPKERKDDTESYGLVGIHEELSRQIEKYANLKGEINDKDANTSKDI